MGSNATHPVRRTRENRELTQAKLAERAGISTSYVSMVENGLVPPLRTQRRIAKALGRTVEALWEGAA